MKGVQSSGAKVDIMMLLNYIYYIADNNDYATFVIL